MTKDEEIEELKSQLLRCRSRFNDYASRIEQAQKLMHNSEYWYDEYIPGQEISIAEWVDIPYNMEFTSNEQ